MEGVTLKHPMSDSLRAAGAGRAVGPGRRYAEAADELDRLHRLLNIPEMQDFLEGVRREAAHQADRWREHDRERTPEDFFWLIGHLAGKALRSQLEGDMGKARHHTISTAAALFLWHRYVAGAPHAGG